MIGSDNIRKGPDRTWAPRGIGHAVTFRCWRCDKTRSTQGAKLIGKLKLKVCAECSNVAGNRLAEGKSELTGLLGGPTRSEKE